MKLYREGCYITRRYEIPEASLSADEVKLSEPENYHHAAGFYEVGVRWSLTRGAKGHMISGEPASLHLWHWSGWYGDDEARNFSPNFEQTPDGCSKYTIKGVTPGI